jgi:hypothetical protein
MVMGHGNRYRFVHVLAKSKKRGCEIRREKARIRESDLFLK